jgi:hypothetical protein
MLYRRRSYALDRITTSDLWDFPAPFLALESDPLSRTWWYVEKSSA